MSRDAAPIAAPAAVDRSQALRGWPYASDGEHHLVTNLPMDRFTDGRRIRPCLHNWLDSFAPAGHAGLTNFREAGLPVESRHAHHPEWVRTLDTDELRRHFLIERVFVLGEINLVYSHLDRMISGGLCPTDAPLELAGWKALGTSYFLERRELGVINIGGPGIVTADGASYDLANRDGLYLGVGVRHASFASADAAMPAKFFLVSTPAHRACETVKITAASAQIVRFGEPATANKRTVVQYVHPDVCDSCQLVLGVTTLDPGNVWNTMPSHTHDRRSEVYLYFNLAPQTRIFHMMGEPTQTRHIVMANEQAVLSPPWSIHSGVGTSDYSFIWGMGGDNQDYRDMDWVAMDVLR